MITKKFLSLSNREAHSAIGPIYPIDHAAWVWHPDQGFDEGVVGSRTQLTTRYATAPAFVRFERGFTAGKKPLVIHVSADQRFDLLLDGKRVARGPDKGDMERWPFATYELKLTHGPHSFEALVWWLGDRASMAQMTWRGGFILKADGEYDDQLTTGKASWRAARIEGSTFEQSPLSKRWFFCAGDSQTIDGAKWFAPAAEWREAVVVRPAIVDGRTGSSFNGWRMTPSRLPDQIDREVTPGVIRAVAEGELAERYTFTESDTKHPAIAEWQAMLSAGRTVSVPANHSVTLVWDLEDYFTGFSTIEISVGKGASVTWEWAEGFWDKERRRKDNRDEIVGKEFDGFGHRFLPDGGDHRVFTPYWWNAGRYCLIRVTTAADPVTVHRLSINETRYPLTPESKWSSDDAALAPVVKICERVMQMCSHDTYMDCPYYEQLMYVADTRVEMLVTYNLTHDDRLARRGMELFDDSRYRWGMTAERYPSRRWQLSPTFSLIWPWMIRDYMMWRGDMKFVRDRVAGVRASLDCIEPFVNKDGLIEHPAGWPVVDWTFLPHWPLGNPPDAETGVSSITNLHWALTLRCAAEIEAALGETLLAKRYAARAKAVGDLVVRRFWDDKKSLLADDPKKRYFSEHCQTLALVGDVLPTAKAKRAFASLLTYEDMARTSIYFRFYLFETFRKLGRGDLIAKGLDFWKALNANGLKTTVESPEPIRSDCHAWGSHPLFHLHASVLGLRPASVGYQTLRIAPQPGPYKGIHAKSVHPRGFVESDLRFDQGRCEGTIKLPRGVTGDFIWRGRKVKLSGKTWVKI
ncbi:MAG: alpha-L-rhamnosidase [Planctomycetes bacterium]|nr:alpha-L-rhamnosidase [Planctomycetota bacterium]